MPLFGKKDDRTAYTLEQFIDFAKKDRNYDEYKRQYEAAGGTVTTGLMCLFETQLRKMGPTKRWSYLANVDLATPAVADTVLYVPTAEAPNFDLYVSESMRTDAKRAKERMAYITDLKDKATTGVLHDKLVHATEPLARYYAPPVPPRRPLTGAPPVPPRPDFIINKQKALAWAVGHKQVEAETRSIYTLAQQLCRAEADVFPITDFEPLHGIWRKLVPGAPVFRPANPANPCKYPSSYFGAAVLKRALRELKTTPVPAARHDRWYDWGLYLFAAIMTSQAFSDGNKRTARFAYMAMLQKGDVPFMAPTAALGAELAQMD